MHKRQILNSFNELLSKYPILAITGPRQSGKTTFLKESFPNYKYVSLESPSEREFFERDPQGFLKEYNENIIFDEAQRIPELFSYIQTIVDQSGKMGQFILSGSQNFHLISIITQSLAGRVAIFKLFPFDFTELREAGLMPSNYAEVLVRGFYPALYQRDISSRVFYNNYIQTYVERDIAQLINIRDVKLFRMFLRLCAARVGQLLNLSSLANDCGITQPTAKAWLSILETSYIVFQLPPYYANFSKRIVKSPKLYFYDTGLVSHMLGIKEPDDLLMSPFKGFLFENLIIAEMYKQSEHKSLQREYCFWRDSNGHEVDLLSLNGLKYDAYEIKASKTILAEQFKGLDYFKNLASDLVLSSSLIYAGEQSQKRTNYNVYTWSQAEDI
jgi:uncharacterized protein